jgi:hypothetical protein
MARVNVVLVGGCAALLLVAACGSDKGSAAQSTTPATATTNTAAPVQTSSPLGSEASTPETMTATTQTTDTPNTTPSTSKATATTAAEPVGGDQYLPASPPTAPDHTHEVTVDESQPDGVYYGTVSEGGDPPPADGSVVFELVQLFIGADCTEHFGADEDACLNDYGVETDPTAVVEVPLADQHITVVDSATQQSYRVTGDELYRLILGEQPAEGAPEGYFYSGFGYFVTIENGEVTRLEQWWTP